MSKRINTSDPEHERAYALADVIQAARQPAHQGMRLGEIIDAMKSARPDAEVQFDFGGFVPTGIDSYRGYYSDLALSYGETGMNVAKLLEELNDANGNVFTGYKGGDYRMDRSTPVWVANVGRCHGVAVIAVDDQGWRVLLRTALIE